MLDQYGLRAHNRRVTNPRTVAHTPVYYRVRSVARVVTMLVVNAFWVAVFLGLILGAWLLAGSAAEWLIGVTK
jgi:dolichol kinase